VIKEKPAISKAMIYLKAPRIFYNLISGFRTLNKRDSYTQKNWLSPGSSPVPAGVKITGKFLYTHFEIYRKMGGQYFSPRTHDYHITHYHLNKLEL
jgi:hypothetical protein